MTKTDDTPVWLITGCSTGFGRALATHVLERGYHAVVTARKPDEVQDLPSKGKALILKLDVTDQNEVNESVHRAEKHFGRIDVLVNNAGIGYFAAVEEGEEAQVRKMFEVNVFGMGKMIRAALPGMRKQGTGSIVNVSSIGGLVGFPALGYYNAIKFAVEGLSEALRKEVEPLGISVTVVEPSGFRTDWAGRSANESKLDIDAYAETAGKARAGLRAVSGKQEGDPERAAQAIVNAIQSPHPPHHLLLGNAAYDSALARLDELRKEFAARGIHRPSSGFPTRTANQGRLRHAKNNAGRCGGGIQKGPSASGMECSHPRRGADSGEDRNLRCVPHRSPRSSWGLALEADAPLHTWS